MTDYLKLSDKFREANFPIVCACCQRTIAHSYHFSSDRVVCISCSSPQPSIPLSGNKAAAARLIRFALRPENLHLAPALVRTAEVAMQLARTKPVYSDELKDLKIDLRF